ncbi:MAG: hypothetical protein H7124_15175 [Phycisphaerales bacterium]|nr:hypothetical protein [Hyphomonadaceae bacterium]
MRAAVAACLLASACATAAPAGPPSERLAGCWINRDAGAVTMRWLPDRARPGVLTGSRLVYGQTGVTRSTRYSLEPSDSGSSLCELGADGAATRCWAVAEGEGGSLEGGRAFIDAHGDRLRISVIGDGPDQDIFHGRRDGCD